MGSYVAITISIKIIFKIMIFLFNLQKSCPNMLVVNVLKISLRSLKVLSFIFITFV